MKLYKKIACAVSALTLAVLACLLLSSCGECSHAVCTEWVQTTAPTCTSTGVRERTCLDCGEILTESVKKKSHDYGDYYSDNNATCTFIGTETSTCSGCGAAKTQKRAGNPYEHTYFDGVCSTCGDTLTLVSSYDASATESDSVTVRVYKDANGRFVLDVVGTGAMKDYGEDTPAPWNEHSANITAVHFYEGVTAIGDRAFRNLSALTHVVVEKGLKRFGADVFPVGFTASVTHVYDMATWVSFELEDESVPAIYMTKLIYIGEVKVGEDGSKSVENRSTTVGDLKIPDGVTKINAYAFYGCAHLTTVDIPASVTEIGDYAFYGCARLDEVHISDIAAWCAISFGENASNPLSIGKRLWLSGELVENLVIPDSVGSISEGAFEGCSSILTATVGSGVKLIPDYAFYGCTRLESVTLSDGLTEIGDWAFYNCDALKAITLPDTVTKIGEDAFRDCDRLAFVELGDGVGELRGSVFSGCRELLHLGLGASVSVIDEGAFEHCKKIVEIYNRSSVDVSALPFASGVLNLYTEEGGSRLTEITDTEGDDVIDPGIGLVIYTDGDVRCIVGYVGRSDTLTLSAEAVGGEYIVYNNAFYNSSVKKLTVADGAVAMYEDAFLGTSLTYVKIADIAAWCAIDFAGVSANPLYYTADLYIGDGTAAVTSLTIPDGVTEISAYAFAGCGQLTSITLPEGLVRIGRDAFYDCTTATKVSSGVSYIGKWAVAVDSSKATITFLTDTAGFADGIFDGASLATVSIPAAMLDVIPAEGIKTLTITSGKLGASAFARLTALEVLTINSSVTDIDAAAFEGCTATSVSVTKSVLSKLNAPRVTTLTVVSGSLTASDLTPFTSLKNLVISSGVGSIEAGSFKNMTTLESVSIRGGITAVPASLFEGCTALKSVSLHSGIKTIEKDAFKGCDSAVTKTDGVSYVDNWIVAIDEGLTSVVVSADTRGIANGVLPRDTALKTIYYLERATMWNGIATNSTANAGLYSATVYYFREVEPYNTGNFWHYVDGVPTPWETEA